MPDTLTLETLLERLDEATDTLEKAPEFSKYSKLSRVYSAAKRVILHSGGLEALEKRALGLERAGVFAGSDWERPDILLPALAGQSLQSENPETVVVEVLSELRLVAVCKSSTPRPLISAEQAHHYLTQVLAINLALLFMPPGEVQREKQGSLSGVASTLLQYLAHRIGYEHIIDRLIEEIWRILGQRPIQVEKVRQMITQIAICQINPEIDLGGSGQGADRLVSSLFGPTQACREDPGIETYQQRLEGMDQTALQYEATGCARSMHDTGLASPYHAVLLRHLLDKGDHLISEALGLSSTGRDCLLCYRELVHALIQEAIYPPTAQGIYGLALMLERAILYQSPVAPAIWRQLALPLCKEASERLTLVFGQSAPPHARLLEGVLCLLGLPLGVGQGNNPTCQSARALSMWAYNDPDYLLQMVAWAARDDEVVMYFEGQRISSKDSQTGVAAQLHLELDPVSLVVVPHLDRIYAEMGRRCIGREGDPHRWVNPEFHGWWAGRGFCINVDVTTGKLCELESFLRHFYTAYHPFYNGNQPIIHPQPAGIAVTDSAARFIGWHAITILRVALDPQDIMRVYFYNPNNDSGQNWGDGVEVSTAGFGERFGEASLPFELFASRLYIFHYDPLEQGAIERVSQEEIERISAYVYRSWGADRIAEN
jgi:hypothetical protein